MPNTETLAAPRTALPNVYTNVSPRELDFVTRFAQTWETLREIMGIARPIAKQDGTRLVSYAASVELESGEVAPGAVIPYSKATLTETMHDDLTIEKYAKAVTIEEVTTYGAEIAVEKTDDAFLAELQNVVMEKFYTNLTTNSSALTDNYETFQMAFAMAIGKVKDKFKKMHKSVTGIVAFVNTLDVYEYLGAAGITVQTAFGIDYIQNFMGAKTVIITSEIEQGTVIAIPSDNMVLYYVDPSTAYRKLNLNYVTDGVTNLIGFKAEGDYATAVGASYAVLGMALWFEYADGVSITTFGETSGETGGGTEGGTNGETEGTGTEG